MAVAAQALKEAEATQRALAAARPKYPATPAAFVRAAAVLRHLERQAERAEARRDSAARAELAVRPAAAPAPVPVLETPTAQLVPAVPVAPAVPAAPAGVRPAVGAAPVRPVLGASVEPLGGAQAAAIVPAPGRQRPRQQASGTNRAPNFSFFGRSGAAGAAVRAAAPAPAVGSVVELGERADLADVLGDEALAESARYAAPEAAPAAVPEQTEGQQEHARPEVVDLTPHDETETLELSELRAKLR